MWYFNQTKPTYSRLSLLYNQHRGLRNRSFRHRQTPMRLGPSSQMLDRYIKLVPKPASLRVYAPFHLKIKGSFFLPNYKIDFKRNKEFLDGNQSNDTPTDTKSSNGNTKTENESILPEPDIDQQDVMAALRFILKEAENSMKEKVVVSDPERTLLKEAAESILNSEDTDDEEITLQALLDREKSKEEAENLRPLHVLVFGQHHHRQDSFSVCSPDMKRHTSHVHISDAESNEDACKMFFDQQHDLRLGEVSPQGRVLALTQIKDYVPKSKRRTQLQEEFVNSMLFYCPRHMQQSPDDLGIKLVFITPTEMNHIWLQADRFGGIEYDGRLLTDVEQISLKTHQGKIKAREVSAHEIRMNSDSGDIMVEGILQGMSIVEAFQGGDILLKHIEGSSLTTTTDTGDILIFGKCNAQRSNFFTNSGNITLKYLYNISHIHVQQRGMVNFNLIKGAISCNSQAGDIYATVRQLTQNSYIQVNSGNITVAVPKEPDFHIEATSPDMNVAPALETCASVTKHNGRSKLKYEAFPDTSKKSSDGSTIDENVNTPTLTILAQTGNINFLTIDTAESIEKSKFDHLWLK